MEPRQRAHSLSRQGVGSQFSWPVRRHEPRTWVIDPAFQDCGIRAISQNERQVDWHL